eukprot:CAMPEP_0185570276 /NCGR_PEP_ID=MMETSP0434-20130131/2649_1 /TAXON_ID=626734 ORGANISM="Favella taraikaensis, Strain Fe Narragansett Bay" /NCGR_SAMPLE_ID=MMETSP0434 /ASSEMBLY_ACC=CAM_ASM_000379 /LENGTH=143 /DNA_ID=CAMNT_0028185353 /DNA_START=377 /DNA_END=808 /DNA_ORIENTATION=-
MYREKDSHDNLEPQFVDSEEQAPSKLSYPRVKLMRENETLENFVSTPMRPNFVKASAKLDAEVKQSPNMSQTAFQPMKMKQVAPSEDGLTLAPSDEHMSKSMAPFPRNANRQSDLHAMLPIRRQRNSVSPLQQKAKEELMRKN